MRDTRSPIERMIDEACGLTVPYTPPPRITLRCPQCHRTQRARLDASDPPGTAVVQARCPECVGSELDEVLYFDQAGTQLCVE